MPAGMAGEVKACVNVLNIVGKRHLQLLKRRRAKREEVGGGGQRLCGDEDTQQTAAHARAATI